MDDLAMTGSDFANALRMFGKNELSTRMLSTRILSTQILRVLNIFCVFYCDSSLLLDRFNTVNCLIYCCVMVH